MNRFRLTCVTLPLIVPRLADDLGQASYSSLRCRECVKPRQRVRVLTHKKDKRSGLRIWFCSPLFPFFQRAFVNPQLAREHRPRAAQFLSSVPQKL